MSEAAASEALHARVRAFIEASLRGGEAEPFDALALSIARFQEARVPAAKRLAAARGALLSEATDASAIPAIPCDVFRLSRVAAHAPEEDARVFRTSGTSQGAGARGEHALRTTATYELGALAWGRRMLWPDRDRLRSIVLAAPPSEARDSSLGFMIERFAEALGGPVSFHVRGGELDADGVARACEEARASGEAAIVLGASFAYVHLLEAGERGEGRDLTLPEGSRAMQTGGFKGRSREVEPGELRGMIARAFGVPETHVVGEYGMTELSSQAYEGTLAAAVGAPGTAEGGEGAARHGVYIAPPWMRVTAVDPATLSPLPAGEVGIGRIVDLANVDSAVAIQTSDRVRILEGGRVELLGRAPGAVPRGCSIAIDEVLGAARELRGRA
jgi:hypothetical protein